MLGTIAGVAALVAGVAVTGGALGIIAAPTLLGVSATAIATVAGVVAGVAGAASGLLAKPPSASVSGSVTNVMVDPSAPQPYLMGEGYFGGVLRHDVGYGATADSIPNPQRGMVIVYSGGGPVQSISPRVDYGDVPTWYSGYLFTTTQLGTTPEASALVPHFTGMPGWSTNHKLSGQAAILWNFKFDKAGKKFASGLPKLGALIQGVKVYDPRFDSTFPGGSGTCRVGVESTYVYSESPALHAGTYAFGRYQNGTRTFGIGLPFDGIDWQAIAAWANVCDANGWKMYGVAFEPGDRWANLKEIAAAGGGQPVFSSGLLSFRFHAPVVALDTITDDDISEGPMTVTAMQSWRDRINTIVPKYRSEEHNWEMVPGVPVSVSSYLSEDGEEKLQEWPWNFVKNKDQAAKLAAYQLVDRRELSPIQITCKRRLIAYRPGDCLNLNLPQLGLATQAIIMKRQFNPATMTVTLTLMGETPAKHAFALGLTGVAPATPSLAQTAEERDLIGDAVFAGSAGPAGPPGDPGPQGETGPKGDPGDATDIPEPILPRLTKASARVTAYVDGSVASYDAANSQFVIRQGPTNISTNFTLSVFANPQGLGVDINQATKEFAVTGGLDPTEETGAVTMRMTGTGSFAGVVLDEVFTIDKLKGGYEIVATNPTTNLFPGRQIYNDVTGKMLIYREGWKPLIDVDSAVAAAQLVGEAPYNVFSKLLIGEFSNLAVNGDLGTGTLDGWTRKSAVNGSTITVETTTTDLNWPSSYAMRMYRHPADGSELSIANGLEPWETFGLNAGITLEPDDELLIEMVGWTTNGSTGFFANVLIKTDLNASSTVPMPFTSAVNCTPSGLNVIIAPGQNYSPVKFSVKNTTGKKGRAWVRLHGPIDAGTEAYIWNLKINRMNGGKIIVDGSILARHINAEVFTGDAFYGGLFVGAKAQFTKLSFLTGDAGTLTAGLLRSPDGRARFELDDGRLIFTNGSYMTVLGGGFGTSGQFTLWVGPAVSNPNQCAENNSILFIKNTGQGYFAGEVDSGVVVNSNQTASVALGAQVILGPINTNGFTKEVTFTVSSGTYATHFDTDSYSYSVAGTASCERSVDGGAWVNVGTLNATGSVVKVGSTGDPLYGGTVGTFTTTLSGSLQIVDLTAPTGNLRYRLVITSTSAGAPSGTVSITCKEG